MRLIDADVMLEELKDKEVVIAQQNIADWIDEQPTIDAEPMVHCGDCVWHEHDSKVCTQFEHDELFDEDCGCNHGEPRDGE